MPLPRLSPGLMTMLSGLLISRGGRRLAGRHAGMLTLAVLGFQLWQNHRDRQDEAATPHPDAEPHPRRRWSGRRNV